MELSRGERPLTGRRLHRASRGFRPEACRLGNAPSCATLEKRRIEGEAVPWLCRLGDAPTCAAVFNDGFEGEAVPKLYRLSNAPSCAAVLTTASSLPPRSSSPTCRKG